MANSLPYANKKLGQHFLNSDEIINNICADFSDSCSAIIEVGPGPGVLTKGLSLIGKEFFVIEKDQRFPELLQEFVPSDKIELTDALEVDLDELIDKHITQKENIWLVSNLPYNVGTPLLVKFLQCQNVKLMTLMFQKEVADKIVPITSKPAKSMNSLRVLTQTFFDCSLLCTVPPESFTPPPKVDSAVISLKRKSETVISYEDFLKFEKFIRNVFALKRKQLGTVLKNSYNQELIEKSLEACEIDRKLRAETLSLDQVHRLYFEMTK